MLQMIRNLFDHSHRQEEGATAVEYGIMVAAIAAVIIGIVITLGGQISNAFQNTSDEVGELDSTAEPTN